MPFISLHWFVPIYLGCLALIFTVAMHFIFRLCYDMPITAVQISGLVYYVRLVKVFIRLYSCQNMSIRVVYQGVNLLLKAYDTNLYLLHINVDLGI